VRTRSLFYETIILQNPIKFSGFKHATNYKHYGKQHMNSINQFILK
jgi:hypothetical protein